MHVIIDCDDVLLSWKRGFADWLWAHYGIRTDDDGPTSWDMASWLKVSKERARAFVTEFNESYSFGCLFAEPGAIDAINTLRRAGFPMTVLTSCSDDPITVGRRRTNLARCFGEDTFDPIICLPMGKPKAAWLKVLRPGVWIEDNYDNALAGLRAGHATFMMRKSHNRAQEATSECGIIWVDSWQQILAHLS